MWIRPSLSRASHFRWCAANNRCHARQSPEPLVSLSSTHENDACSFVLTRELKDDLHVPVSPSTQHGRVSNSNGTNSNVASASPAELWLPFQTVLLSYAMHPAFCTLATSHTLLMTSLAETPDLLLQLSVYNPCGGGVAAARLSCVWATFAMIQPYRRDTQLILSLPLQQRQLVDEIRLVQLVASTSPNASVLVSKELEHMSSGNSGSNGCDWCSSELLWTLLSVPCAVEVLNTVLVAALRQCPTGLTAHIFQKVTHALLKNDNFFCERTFDTMHRLLLNVVLPAVADGSSGCSGSSSRAAATKSPSFDFLAVRWTLLMNRWSRVYTKSRKGFLLYDCLCALLRAVPPVETKLPSSFYVRLLGGLLDASTVVPLADGSCGSSNHGNNDEVHSKQGWEKIQMVANDALRLFGRNAADMRSIWVLLLKAALTLPPLGEGYQRLLDAYHLCVQCGHAAPLDRQGFLQVTRLVSEAICTLPTVKAVDRVVPQFCTFLYEQDNANFLWLLDSVGTILTDLWDTHGAAAADAAQELLITLERLLRDRRVTGVDIYANPVIAHALQHFQLGGPILFWWTCGCGAELPCSAKRCTACLRSSSGSGGLSWMCATCKKTHQVPCGVQACTCGKPNPRLAAATRTGHAICGTCGEVKDTAQALCVRCENQRAAQGCPVTCTHCRAAYKSSALHCPNCFAVNPNKPPLYLWHCESCDSFNYSIWSTCRTCKAPRRSGAFMTPFVAWACGCGTLNHPGRLVCSVCGTGARHHTFTCAGCYAHVAMRSLRRVVVTVDGKRIAVHFCPHCQTPHPRSDLLLYSPLLPRHCMLCATTIRLSSAAAAGGFHHCGTLQSVNENYVFHCKHCCGEEERSEVQTGYHCKHCLFPRPEVEAMMVDCAPTTTAAVTFVWRCLHESEEGDLCGQWNYGWSAHCLACGTGRPDSAFQCRAKAQFWQCETCSHANRPIDVLFCPHCKRGLQPVPPCVTCGMPHLSFSCRIHMQKPT